MKDFLGNEVKIGDLVAFIYSPRYDNTHQLMLGTVKKITSLQVEVEIDDYPKNCRKIQSDKFVILNKQHEFAHSCRTCEIPHNKWTGCPKIDGKIPYPNFSCNGWECSNKYKTYLENIRK